MRITSVPTDSLHEHFGFDERFELAESSREKPLPIWKMEIDDAPIIRYLFRNFQPHRHLEFGTWQGSGTTYCLEESDATVWTINLPFGQKRIDGTPNYGNEEKDAEEVSSWARKIGMPSELKYHVTDRIGFIGRLYLDRDLGNRVCQIYCDSRDWDVSHFPPNFFDTVLIDGGHKTEVVLSDTKKALRLVRPGGLILWHDFFLDADALEQMDQVAELVDAMNSNLDWIGPKMKDLCWIDPSWLLVGRKAGSPGKAARYFRRCWNALLSRPTEIGPEPNSS